jgi:hypothetical protein
MTLIRKLAWVLFWVSLCTTFSSNSQDISVTGNLVNNSTTDNNVTTKWQNIGSWNQGLPCWKGGDPGCTSSVYFNNGSFNFSYGTTNVSQAVSISTALANSGTGLQVNGFNFGFTAKNGNGWDNGMQDYLVAYANFKNAAGTVVQSYDYSNATNRKYNWTTFYFSETFTTPYAVKDLSTATYGFIGRDNNYWQGPYGPEINGVNFSLKYSVAPPPPTPPTTTTTTIVAPTTTTATPTVSSDPTSAPVTSVSVGGVQLSSEGTISAPDSIPQVVKDTQSSAATTTTIQATPSSTTATSQTESNKSNVNMSLVMSTIKAVQENVKTTEKTATQNASKQLATQIANSQEQTSQAMASTNAISSASSQASQTQPSSGPQTQLIGGGPAQTSSTAVTTTQQVQVAAYTPPKMQMAETQTVAVITSEPPKNGTGLSVSFQNNNSQQISYSLLPQPVEQIIQKPVFFQPKQESRANENELHVLQSNNFANRTNPINQVLEQRMILESSTTEQKVETVKSNVAPNELAGGVDIASIASLPKGYDGYVNFTMKDVSFYKVEDIYKNQNTVDNVRAMRQLSSDRLHQEMVNQQYRN